MIFNYDENNNITAAGYEINSDLLNAKRSPISTLNFSKNIDDVKSIADIFKGKIIPVGLFSASHLEYSQNDKGDFLDDLKDLIQRPNITLDKIAKKHPKTKKHIKMKKSLIKKRNRKTKRNK